MAHSFKVRQYVACCVGPLANKATDDLQFYVGGHTVTIEQGNLSNPGLFDVDRG